METLGIALGLLFVMVFGGRLLGSMLARWRWSEWARHVAKKGDGTLDLTLIHPDFLLGRANVASGLVGVLLVVTGPAAILAGRYQLSVLDRAAGIETPLWVIALTSLLAFGAVGVEIYKKTAVSNPIEAMILARDAEVERLDKRIDRHQKRGSVAAAVNDAASKELLLDITITSLSIADPTAEPVNVTSMRDDLTSTTTTGESKSSCRIFDDAAPDAAENPAAAEVEPRVFVANGTGTS